MHSRLQPPAVPSTKFEPEQASLGVDASSFFNMVRRHEEQQQIEEAVKASRQRRAKKKFWLRFKSSTFFFSEDCGCYFSVVLA